MVKGIVRIDGREGGGVSVMSEAHSSAEAGQGGGYGTGTVSIAKGSTVLRGKDTIWHSLIRGGLPAAPRNGKIVIAGGDEIYDVQLVNSDGLITLKRPFAREAVEGAGYVFYEDAVQGPLARAANMQAQSTALTGSAQPSKTQLSALPQKGQSEQAIWEAVRTVGYALLIALVIRAFFVQPFNIPSESMVPTLLKGDYLFVAKYPYGYSKHSLPFSPPLFMGRIFGHEPARGDVIVFKLPSDNRTDYIKRLVGLPGDHIQVIDGALYINGKAVKRERIEDEVETDPYGGLRRIPRYRETMPNGVSYNTLDSDPNGTYDNTEEFVVPAGHYFMMGDNRDNSMDSRATPNYQFPRMGGVGYVPFENLVGRAEFIFFSTDGSARFWEFWRWPEATRWNRLFEAVR